MKRTSCRTDMPQGIAGAAALVAPVGPTATGGFVGHRYEAAMGSIANRSDAWRPLGLEKAPPD